ncbi:MAG: Fic family protein [Burkholderiaceae bacterium]|jgi:Fic family protein|nr:Fic family protein [Burkholderiaceae bacterium]
MKFEQFKAGVWRQQYQYKSFSPIPVNQAWTWEDPGVHTLLEQANRALGELNAFSLIVPDIDLFIEMHVVKEAQTSSRIEGTQTGMNEALLNEDQIKPEQRDDWREVHNYIDAVNMAIADLKTLPLSNRLLKNAHALLMSGVRGEHKQPGEFRVSQNWIGGSSLADAVFIPPHPMEVDALMGDLELFWHNEMVKVPHLVRIAVAHYQFETIHPFLDGNGRIGRLMIPLYLVSNGLLAKPSLYLSDFFERNRASYYDALMRVRMTNDMLHWVRFFLSGIAETAAKGRDVFRELLLLRTEVETQVLSLGKRAPLARQALNFLYSKPIANATMLETKLNVTTPTANALIRDLIRLGILIEVSGLLRGRVYAFDKYLKLFGS